MVNILRAVKSVFNGVHKRIDEVDANVKDVEAKLENPEQMQTDWDQNDESATNYLKNRPFYTGDANYSLIKTYTGTKTSDYTLTFTFPWQDGYDNCYGSKNMRLLINQEVFNVTLGFSDNDGHVTLRITSDQGINYDYDIDPYTEETIELTMGNALTEETYEVKWVKDYSQKIKTIEEIYIPETIARTKDVDEKIESVNTALGSYITDIDELIGG